MKENGKGGIGMQKTKLSPRFWLALTLFSLIGQVAWVVENMYFNVFIYKMFHASASDISLMVAASAVAATVTTLLIGALSDKLGKRRLFICGGYILWGISIWCFAALRVDVIASIFPMAASAASVGVSLVIIMDCVMTFFGSSANDACLNAWLTDATDATNRGSAEGVNAMMPLIAILVVFGGFMGFDLDRAESWTVIYAIIGSVVLIAGILGFFLIRDTGVKTEENQSYFKNIFYGFRPGVVRENKILYVEAVTEALDPETENPDASAVTAFEEEAAAAGIEGTAEIYNDEGEIEETFPVSLEDFQTAAQAEEPDPANYGVWVPGIPVLLGNWLESIRCADWLQGLLLDGIVAGVGAVLGFVPQMLVLFLLLAFLESCGYMARIAFVMDRIFRKFGLSGKSFIPMLIGTGCGVPGIMASRTIENERDRRMTIMTTTFIPCGAKLPIIALIAGALFQGAWWVAPSAYFVGIAAIILSGVMLKKTRMFAGEPAPFVMELPAYHWPTAGNLLHSMWERGWSFIKKAGTIILLATILVWFASNFGWADGSFGMVEMNDSILAAIGSAICVIFVPLGWGNWQGAVATITGLIAKENVVGTFGVLFGGFDEVAENGWQIWNNMQAVFTPLAAYSFLVFNLLCAPCFAAMGAIKREMNNGKWTAFAIAYQCGFAYAAALIVYQLGMLFTGGGNVAGSIAALVLVALMVFLLVRPYQEPNVLRTKIRT